MGTMGAPTRKDGYWLWLGGPVPPGAAGITVGRLVSVRRSAALLSSFDELLRHELVHVGQFAELGWPRFLVRYLHSYVHFRVRGYGHHQAYVRIPLEVEARVAARRPPAPTVVIDRSDSPPLSAFAGML